ncbi:class I SAM-dependent methyltransferase [Arcticibacterium luteifluviistationis]|uniref:SAM-dependent methyltransferase n=1 Tax=Arcticibacterium luteifluviistationis TaxID=1784714 RepID=A0A2Z4G7G5_9BACT|nr:class I SAM-dependent methyltransferase [Arcticibacterium luteifluviistationis]AWV97102.1 SAM-dependent methyltransferase [Arcticibacterium luteifluviistationis]
MKEKWDARYSEGDFAYGKEPNVFFKEWLPKFEAGTILMPADGEGRNGVFAAMEGWKVTSLDLSEEGKTKALKLAKEQGVDLNYLVGDLEALNFDKASFDAIGLIYAHFGADKKSALHKKLDQYLKVGGHVIFEAFSKKHLDFRKQNPKVGGPNNIDTLFSKEEISSDFKNYEVLLLEEREIELNEGNYHIGKGSVIRFVGRKVNGNLSS